MFTETPTEADIVFTRGIYDRKVFYMKATNEAGYEYLYNNGFNPNRIGVERQLSIPLAKHIMSYAYNDDMNIYAPHALRTY